MDLKKFSNLKKADGFDVIIMDELREKYPEKFNESGGMDYKWFEEEIRPNNFIYIRQDKNSLSFTLQRGNPKEFGVNGCSVRAVIEMSRNLIQALHQKNPTVEYINALDYLDIVLDELE